MKLSFLAIFLAFSFSYLAQTEIILSNSVNGQTFIDCNSFIIDSGGQGGPGYSNDEHSIITICGNNPAKPLSLVFNTFNLSIVDDFVNGNQVDYVKIYDGASSAEPLLGTYTGTQLEGIVFLPSVTNMSGCFTIEFQSNSSGTGKFTASANCKIPCNNPVAGGVVLNGVTSDSIQVCLNEEINFKEQGSIAQPGFNIKSYKWDFMDNATSNLKDAKHAYTIPGYYLVQLFITDDNPDNICKSKNLINLKVLVAPAPDFTGFPKDTTLCIGESIELIAKPKDYEVLWNGFSNITSISDGCLSDDKITIAQNVDLMQNQFKAGSTITNINQIQSICIGMEHTYIGDLDIKLICPNGQNIMLHQQGGTGCQLGDPDQDDGIDCSDPSTIGKPFNYCFTPVASLTWADWALQNTSGAVIPAGDYSPIGSFSSLIGCPTNGVWTISVTDNYLIDDGCVFYMALNLDPILLNNPISFKPTIGVDADSSYWTIPNGINATLSSFKDSLKITPNVSGVQKFKYSVLDKFGCLHDTTFTLTIKSNPILNIGNDTLLCSNSPFQFHPSITQTNNSTSYIYRWSPSLNITDSTIVSPSLKENKEGIYTLSLYPNGHPQCIASDQVKISVLYPKISLGLDRTICPGEIIELKDDLNFGNSFLWSTNETSKSINVNTGGVYWLKSSNSICDAFDTINVTLLKKTSLSDLPNIISVNNDGINDQYKFEIVNAEKFEFTIVNRWGDKIFSTTNPIDFWDGKYKGVNVTEGVYFYLLKYNSSCENQTTIEKKGFITVVN